MPASDRPTFSQSWSRVSGLTPRLRPLVQIHRQLYRGEIWHVAHDPIGHNFFRLSPVAYHFVGLLDGRRTVDEVWRLTLERFADGAPTQDEAIGLLAQMNESNLLRVDLPADAEPLLRRARTRSVKHWTGQAMSLLFMQIPLFNPDKLLNWLMPLARPIFSAVGLIVWVVWMVYCLLQFVPYAGDFLSDADSVLAPSNWGYLILLTIITKTVHELSHGLMCKRFGGRVPEVGVMLLVLFPMPFVNATAAWNFPQKWKRLLVSAAGMMSELAIAGGAALFWINAEAGVPKQIAYNLVFLASVSTVIFNGNPLLRFDGYYMLSDMIEVPNLYQRSTNFLKWLVQKFAYGIRRAQPPTTLTYERCWFLVYGIASQIYRFSVLFGIILFVAGGIPSLGILLAIWSGIAWVIVPVCKFVHYLATNPSLHEHRARAIAVTVVFALALLVGLGAIHAPEHRRVQGIVESANRAEVAIGADGVVDEVLIHEGDSVEQGQVIMRLSNRELDARADELRARRAGLEASMLQAAADDPAQVSSAQTRLETIDQALDVVRHRREAMVIRSPRSGVFVGTSLGALEGRYVQRGEVIGRVEDLDHLRVTALVDQSGNADLFRAADRANVPVELRSSGAIPVELPSKVVRVFDSGRTSLPHPALGYLGGGDIATDPTDQQGAQALHPQFELWFAIPTQADIDNPDTKTAREQVAFYPGQRIYVRMRLPDRPLLAQWYDRLRKTVRERLLL